MTGVGGEKTKPGNEPPVGVDSAGVYEGLSAEDMGYGDLPRVDEAAADPPPEPD